MASVTPLSEILERQYVSSTAGWGLGSCPGCGGGIATQALARAIDRAGIDPDKIVIVQGITCSGTPANLLNYNNVWSLHGRALAYATGLKMARPDLTVIAIQGDGDAAAIGGNHLIHAARRNLDITTVIHNNFTYGRTGGQCGPTTPKGARATSAPYGTIDPMFDICKLAEAAGATFVARGTTYHVLQLVDIMEKALHHHGFSSVEVITQCPESFGRYNPGLTGRTPAEMMCWIRDNTVPAVSADGENPDAGGKIVRGVFVDREDPEYGDEYQKLVERVRGGER